MLNLYDEAAATKPRSLELGGANLFEVALRAMSFGACAFGAKRGSCFGVKS